MVTIMDIVMKHLLFNNKLNKRKNLKSKNQLIKLMKRVFNRQAKKRKKIRIRKILKKVNKKIKINEYIIIIFYSSN